MAQKHLMLQKAARRWDGSKSLSQSSSSSSSSSRVLVGRWDDQLVDGGCVVLVMIMHDLARGGLLWPRWSDGR